MLRRNGPVIKPWSQTETWSPHGQTGLNDKILASDSVSASWYRPQPLPWCRSLNSGLAIKFWYFVKGIFTLGLISSWSFHLLPRFRFVIFFLSIFIYTSILNATSSCFAFTAAEYNYRRSLHKLVGSVPLLYTLYISHVVHAGVLIFIVRPYV